MLHARDFDQTNEPTPCQPCFGLKSGFASSFVCMSSKEVLLEIAGVLMPKRLNRLKRPSLEMQRNVVTLVTLMTT